MGNLDEKRIAGMLERIARMKEELDALAAEVREMAVIPAPVVEEAPAETAAAEPEAVAEEAVIEEAAVEQPAAEPEQLEEAQDYATPEQIAARLVARGFDPEIARQVTGIFADSTSYRAAYNKLRSVFGNNTGRDYYQSAKRILSE